jgi:hypothetical protein
MRSETNPKLLAAAAAVFFGALADEAAGYAAPARIPSTLSEVMEQRQ